MTFMSLLSYDEIWEKKGTKLLQTENFCENTMHRDLHLPKLFENLSQWKGLPPIFNSSPTTKLMEVSTL